MKNRILLIVIAVSAIIIFLASSMNVKPFDDHPANHIEELQKIPEVQEFYKKYGNNEISIFEDGAFSYQIGFQAKKSEDQWIMLKLNYRIGLFSNTLIHCTPDGIQSQYTIRDNTLEYLLEENCFNQYSGVNSIDKFDDASIADELDEEILCMGERGHILNDECQQIGMYHPETGIPIVDNKEDCKMLDGNWIEEQNTCELTNSLKIPNPERDAKLDAGCKLYSGGGWACPDTSETANFENITQMKPNSVEFFYYPDPEKNKDTHQLFMLIRLPEWMGGAENDISAFRAYSAKALDDPCIVKYWPDVGRQRIENPCQGAMYRVIDGALTYGAIHSSTAMTALPYLDLSIGKNGMLYVEPPNFIPSENGVIGFGRNLSLDEIRSNSEFLAESFAKYYPKYPIIPTEFAGHILSEIAPEGYFTTVRYLDFPNKSGHIIMTIGLQTTGMSYPNLSSSNVEYWKIGDTEIRIGGSALDKDNDIHESFRTYEIKFKGDGYYYTIEGKNIEFLKKSLVATFFPEFTYEDLVLVSTTTK